MLIAIKRALCCVFFFFFFSNQKVVNASEMSGIL